MDILKLKKDNINESMRYSNLYIYEKLLRIFKVIQF